MQRDQDWLREAEAELGAARDLLGGGHWSWCCFTAQQAAEKALKAVCEHLRAPNVLRQAIDGHVAVPQAVRLAVSVQSCRAGWSRRRGFCKLAA